MKILTEYTLNYLNKNKKNAISIIIIITIAVILLSTVVLAAYMNWNYNMEEAIYRNGNFHGYFKSYIDKSQIPYLEENQKLEKVYLKSEYYTGKLDMERPYINLSYLDKEYWGNMGEKNQILEGRIPNNQNEIVVMNNFIKENPMYDIGSKINVELGYREKDGEKIDVFDFLHSDENFVSESVEEYTVVGIISGRSLSYEPYYKGLGFLDTEIMNENIKLNAYLRMNNPRNIFKDLPEIGEILGLELGKDTDSEYLNGVGYNLSYLRSQGIFHPYFSIWEQGMNSIIIPFVFLLLIMFMFSIIIYNVFAVWSNNRLRQLGILKSIGTTPKQIKKTVKVEAILLSILPIILGMGLGHLICYLGIDIIKGIVSTEMDGSIFYISFKTSPLIIVIIVILSFLTILISISRTARRLSKISPIEAIRYGGLNYDDFKDNKGRGRDYDSANIIHSLSKDSLKANKKGFRTTAISIGIGFTVLFALLVVISGVKGEEYLNTLDIYYPLRVFIYSNEISDENLFKEIKDIKSVKEMIVRKTSYLKYKVYSEYESDEFGEIIGFENIDSKEFSIKAIDDYYEVGSSIIGLDDDSFNEYAKHLGENPDDYYDIENPKAILLNLIKEDLNEPIRRSKYIPYFKDDVDVLDYRPAYGGKSSSINIGVKTHEKPFNDFYVLNCNINLFIPKSILNTMMEEFDLPGDYSHSEEANILVDEKDMDDTKEEIKEIVKNYIPESDYLIWDKESYEIEKENTMKLIYLLAYSFVSFMGIIGVSNSYSSINNNLRNRRREFAMLKSMGMTKKDISKMLKVEGIYYTFYPYIYSIPFSLIVGFLLTKGSSYLNLKDYLTFFDYKVIIIYIIAISISIYSAYYFGIRKIEKDEIVDVLKDESI